MTELSRLDFVSHFVAECVDYLNPYDKSKLILFLSQGYVYITENRVGISNEGKRIELFVYLIKAQKIGSTLIEILIKVID